MSSFFSEHVTDEEFEFVFKKLCTMVVFYEKKRLSVSAVFIFLVDNPEFVDYLVEEANLGNRMDAFRKIVKMYPNIVKSKVVLYRALEISAIKNKKHDNKETSECDENNDSFVGLGKDDLQSVAKSNRDSKQPPVSKKRKLRCDTAGNTTKSSKTRRISRKK